MGERLPMHSNNLIYPKCWVHGNGIREEQEASWRAARGNFSTFQLERYFTQDSAATSARASARVAAIRNL